MIKVLRVSFLESDFFSFENQDFFFLIPVFFHDSSEITGNGSTTQGVVSYRARDFVLDFIFLAVMLRPFWFFT